MSQDLASMLLGTAGGLVVLFFWFMLFMVTVGWPLMAWSAMRNIKGIRHELARLNGNLESRDAPHRTGTLGI